MAQGSYHVNSKGDVGRCSARINCPFGGDSGQDEHFNTPEEAREFAEKKTAEQYLNNPFSVQEKEAAPPEEELKLIKARAEVQEKAESIIFNSVKGYFPESIRGEIESSLKNSNPSEQKKAKEIIAEAYSKLIDDVAENPTIERMDELMAVEDAINVVRVQNNEKSGWPPNLKSAYLDGYITIKDDEEISKFSDKILSDFQDSDKKIESIPIKRIIALFTPSSKYKLNTAYKFIKARAEENELLSSEKHTLAKITELKRKMGRVKIQEHFDKYSTNPIYKERKEGRERTSEAFNRLGNNIDRNLRAFENQRRSTQGKR